jgi:hypothetical protein
MSERLFKAPSAAGHFVDDENKDLARTLTGLLRPDMALSPPVPEIDPKTKKPTRVKIKVGQSSRPRSTAGGPSVSTSTPVRRGLSSARNAQKN